MFDDIVIGSGLAALGAVLGLLPDKGRRIAVLCGPNLNRFSYYDNNRTSPCAFLGEGGLGTHWHGVIPTGQRHVFGESSDRDFTELFARFYPHTQIGVRLGSAGFFVPWRPVRPFAELARLAHRVRPERLLLIREEALDLRFDGKGVQAATAGGQITATRAWVAAGALHTPALLGRSISPSARRPTVSDHVLCYIGQVGKPIQPAIAYSRDGLFFPARYDKEETVLYSTRPACFAFRKLDAGIGLRSAFGLPTGSLLAKLARRLSAGLLVEAAYNRLGLNPGAAMHSVYAQIPVDDAYEFGEGDIPLRAQLSHIRRATDAARAAQPFAGLRHSCQPQIFLPGIHLHHTLDQAELTKAGVDLPDSPVQVIDASTLMGVGPDHHSFKLMLKASLRARSVSVGEEHSAGSRVPVGLPA